MDAKNKPVRKSERGQPEKRAASHARLITSDPIQIDYSKGIIATIREPLVVLDKNLQVLSANRSFYRFFKVKAGETVGKLIYDLGNRQWDIPALRHLLETILPQKAVFNDYEVEHDFPTIGKRILLLNARRIPRPPKEAQRILLVFDDITERMRLEHTLQASEQRFRLAFEAAIDSILLVDKISGRVLNSNLSAQHSFNCSMQMLLKKNLWELDILKDHQQFEQISEELEKTGTVELSNRTIRIRGGGQFYADINLMGRPTVIQCNIRDITERKQTQILQEAVYRIATAAETTKSLDDFYPKIHQIISSVMPAENFYITLYEETQNLLRFPYFKDAKDKPLLVKVQPGKGLTAYVLRTGKSLLCTQAVHDELERQGEVKLLGVPSAIWLGVPLVVEGKTIGAMVVQHYSNPTAYGEREQHMLEFVSTQVAIAIERKQAEEALRESQRRLVTLMGNLPGLAYRCKNDPNWTMEFVSDGCYPLTGYQPADLISNARLSYTQIIHPKDRQMVWDVIQAELKKKQPYQLNYRIITSNGEERWVWEQGQGIYDPGGNLLALEGFITNITELKRAEAGHNQSEALFRALFELSPDSIVLIDPQDPNVSWPIIDCNQAACLITGYQRDELIGQSIDILNAKPGTQAERTTYRKQLREAGKLDYEVLHRHKNGTVFPVEVATIIFMIDGRELVLGVDRDITERKRVEGALRESEEKYRSIFENIQDVYYETLLDGTILEVSPSIEVASKGQYHREDLIGRSMHTFYTEPKDRESLTATIQKTGRVTDFEVALRNRDNSLIPCSVTAKIQFNAQGNPEKITGSIHDISELKHREEEILSWSEELATLYGLSRALADANDLESVIELVNRQVVENVHTTFACIALLKEGDLVPWAVYPVRDQKNGFRIGDRQPISSLPTCQCVMKKNEPVILQADSLEVTHAERILLMLDFTRTVCIVPLRVGDASEDSKPALGLLILGEARKQKREPFTPEKIRLARSIGDQAASAIHRLQLREQTGRRLQRLVVLSNIDRAISTTFDLHISLELLLKHVKEQLGVDATDILLFHSASNTLEFSAGLGFRTKAFEHARLQLGEMYAGQAALKREIIHIPDLVAQHDNPRLEKHLVEEQFVSYYGVPLIAKEQIMGVLEIFQRTRLEPDKEWLDFLSTLAGQAAIAIDSVMQFEDVRRSKTELALAYNATIEGWSHALDLRDKETEGHTQRVTEMTVKLARRFGLSEEDLAQVRWGALLHDIGKMGVPDNILLKPGPLTDEEWVVMKKHPVFAYEMLSPIRYLIKALDIPYCHHEKWDGTGYPRGLKGTQIPLVARIFAVVDVWDALISDRPYRRAWSEKKALQYIQSEAGTHFDPQVVKEFLVEHKK